MNGEQLLQRSLQIFEERRANYGLAKHHFHEVAKRWSLVLGCEIRSHQVVMCLIELKLARLKENPTHLDSIIDIAGYPHLELFAQMALHTLSRKRAILELQWNQVDFDLRQIDFNPPNRVRTKKRRVPVPMNNTLMAALLKAREYSSTAHVIEFRGQPCYEIGRAFRKYAQKAELGWITPHVLRHTGATLMAQNGVNMVDIAGIMGDRIDTVEKHYLKYHPDYLKGATTALEKIYA